MTDTIRLYNIYDAIDINLSSLLELIEYVDEKFDVSNKERNKVEAKIFYSYDNIKCNCSVSSIKELTSKIKSVLKISKIYEIEIDITSYKGDKDNCYENLELCFYNTNKIIGQSSMFYYSTNNNFERTKEILLRIENLLFNKKRKPSMSFRTFIFSSVWIYMLLMIFFASISGNAFLFAINFIISIGVGICLYKYFNIKRPGFRIKNDIGV